MEDNFDREGELKRLGGTLYDFDKDDGNILKFNNVLESRRSQHYEWLVPLYYKNTEKVTAEANVLYL